MSTTTRPTRQTANQLDVPRIADQHLERAWWVVARREMLVKLTDKAFLFSTIIMVVVIAGFVGLQAYLGDRTQEHTIVALTSDQAQVSELGAAITRLDDKVQVTVTGVPDDAAAKAALEDGEADAWLHRTGDGWTLTSRDEVPDDLATAATTVIRSSIIAQNAAAAGTTPAAIEAGSQLQTSILHGDAQQQTFGKVLGFVLAFLFYMASIGFGMTLAMSVVEEKASRIVEIITTKIPVRQLLAGKVLGNAALALGQMALFTGIGLIGLSFTPYGRYVPY